MTKMRSLLFVPGDCEASLTAAGAAAADILVLDLQSAADAERKARARGLVREYLQGRPVGTRSEGLWVRIDELAHPEAGADLGAVMPFQPDGIVLPGARSAQDCEALATRVGHYEAEHEIAIGTTRIIALAATTPASVFTLGGYAAGGKRLAGLAWDADALAAAVGAVSARDPQSGLTDPFRLVRSLCLFGAHAAGVAAIDGVHPVRADTAGLERACAEARRDGFSGKLAVDPEQVETINRVFG